MASSTNFYRSQAGGSSIINYGYTDFPWRLFVKDLYYFFAYSWSIPWILWPFYVSGSSGFNELSATWGNMFCVALHVFLLVLQGGFLVSLPLCLILPVWMAVGGIGVFVLLNTTLCRLLNGSKATYNSEAKYAPPRPEHAHEQWVFVNGVSVGRHWLQGNLNRLAITFKRPILGIHNPTSGIIFDLIECLVQRNFSYATSDVRNVYRVLKDVLYDPGKSKVVLILHSQGGIEGGLVIDWLLQELPQDLLSKLEVYTFGNAANHFNNPHRHVISQQLIQRYPYLAANTIVTETSATSPITPIEEPRRRPLQLSTAMLSSSRTALTGQDRAISHVEHYAHINDFVALLGVLHFVTNTMGSPQIPRFVGRLFARSSGNGGHLFNQHYLEGMFPLAQDPKTGEVVGADEQNPFMDEIVGFSTENVSMDDSRESLEVTVASTWRLSSNTPEVAVAVHGVDPEFAKKKEEIKARDLCRLWSYRNGRSPKESPPLLFLEGGIPRNATL